MMPDDRDTANARTKLELAELIGLVGNAYTREGLSPPSQLYRPVDFWRGLSRQEILNILDDHFDRNRQFYLGGSGDGLFYLVQAEIRKALEAKRPVPTVQQSQTR
jgi:hypothetical protein